MTLYLLNLDQELIHVYKGRRGTKSNEVIFPLENVEIGIYNIYIVSSDFGLASLANI